MSTPSNALNVKNSGLVKFDGTSQFSAATTTQYNVLSGAASNGINNITPSNAGYVLTSNGPSAQPSFQAAPSGNITITGDSGSITGTNLTIYSNLAANGSGSTVLFSNSSTTSTLKVSDASANTLIGNNAGNASVSGIHNTSLGVNTLAALTSGQKNTVLGWNCGTAITNGYANVIIGDNSGTALTSGQYNIIIGHETAPNLTSTGFPNGCFNVILGVSSGSNYTNNEANNVIIGSGVFGVAGESNVMRLGSQGPYQFTAATYIAGVYGVTVTGSAVLCDANGQFGTISSSIRYKENIEYLDNSYSILDLQPVRFNYKTDDDKTKCFGLIAEDVEKTNPELVLYRNGEPDSIKYHEMTALLLLEIKKLKSEIDTLKQKITG